MSWQKYSFIILFVISFSFILGKYVFYSESTSAVILNHSSIPFDLENCAAEGPGNAPITLVEFADLECRYSLKNHKNINALSGLELYNQKIQYYFRSFPLQRNKTVPQWAKAIEAAGTQGKAKEMRECLFTQLSHLPLKKELKFSVIIDDCVEKLGLDKKRFEMDLQSDEITGQIAKNIDEGKNHGVRAVPTVFINGYIVQGAVSIECYKAIVNKLISK